MNDDLSGTAAKNTKPVALITAGLVGKM
jgi:hypothetical protein